MVPNQVHDEGDTFHNALAFAYRLALGQFTTADQENPSFRLSPESYEALLHHLQSEPSPCLNVGGELGLGVNRNRLDTRARAAISFLDSDSGFSSDGDQAARHSFRSNLDKLRIEYDAEDGLLTFKMPETRVHTDFAASICHRITVAAEPLIEDFRSRGTPDIELKGKSKSRSKKVPDIAWGRSPLETNPPIVAEVAYSHPNGSKDLEILKKICQGYLEGTRGRRKIRTVLGFKIYYPTNPTSNFEAILEHLDECFAGV